MAEAEQTSLLDLDSLKEWKKHWQGMPEFEQKNLEPRFSLYVHFKSIEDRDAFAELVGQSITELTRSIWYPKVDWACFLDKLFIDKSGEGSAT